MTSPALRTRPAFLTRPAVRSPAVMWALLLAWVALWAWLRASPSGISWHFFTLGADRLVHGDGVHLYARNPELQIGPLTFVVAVPLGWLPHQAAQAVAQVLMTAMLPAGLALLAPLLPERDRALRLLLVAVPLAPAWTVLSVRWAHLDDALALLLACAVVHAAVRGRPVLAGLALAGAVDAKPWAIGVAAVLLLLPGRRVLAAGVAVAGMAVAWGPFLLGDTGTLAALHPQVGINDSSTLSLLGYGGATVPAWDRTVQLVAAPAAGLLAVLRRSWPGALLCAIAVRLALDPQDIGYYAAGAVLAAAIFDLLATRHRIPWVTLATWLALWQPFVPDFAQRLRTSHGLSLLWFRHQHVVAAVHLVWAVVVVALVVARPSRLGLGAEPEVLRPQPPADRGGDGELPAPPPDLVDADPAPIPPPAVPGLPPAPPPPSVSGGPPVPRPGGPLTPG